MLLHNFKQEEAKIEGTGDGKPPVDDKKDTGAQDIALLRQAVGLLAQSQDDIKNSFGSLQAAIVDLKPKEPAPKELTPEGILEGVDLTGMDNGQIATLVLQKATQIATELVDKKLKEHGEVINTRVGDLATTVYSANAKTAMAEVAKDNLDFFEWGPEMRKLIGEHPTLDVRSAFALAKSQDPEKTAEMAKKYNKAPDTKVYSLTPRSSFTEGSGKMSQKEAAADAFDKVFGQAQHLLNSDTNVF